QDCTVLLISDASGQMKSEAKPGGDAVSVLKRSNDVLMARVRGAQYRDLATRRSASLLRGLMFLHLKKDLDVTPVEWVDSDEPIDPDDTRVRSRRGNVTSYGVSKRIQGLVAVIRTDLDSFSDAEANALMLSGYQMA